MTTSNFYLWFLNLSSELQLEVLAILFLLLNCRSPSIHLPTVCYRLRTKRVKVSSQMRRWRPRKKSTICRLVILLRLDLRTKSRLMKLKHHWRWPRWLLRAHKMLICKLMSMVMSGNKLNIRIKLVILKLTECILGRTWVSWRKTSGTSYTRSNQALKTELRP